MKCDEGSLVCIFMAWFRHQSDSGDPFCPYFILGSVASLVQFSTLSTEHVVRRHWDNVYCVAFYDLKRVLVFTQIYLLSVDMLNIKRF